MTLETLKQLLESSQFDHATYRNIGTLWEGLWIYRKTTCAVGFEPAGCFSKNDPQELQDAAYDMVRMTGVSVGSRGNG